MIFFHHSVFFPTYCDYDLIKGDASALSALKTRDWKCKNCESYLLKLQGEETNYLGQNVFPFYVFGLLSIIISTEQLNLIHQQTAGEQRNNNNFQ